MKHFLTVASIICGGISFLLISYGIPLLLGEMPENATTWDHIGATIIGALILTYGILFVFLMVAAIKQMVIPVYKDFYNWVWEEKIR